MAERLLTATTAKTFDYGSRSGLIKLERKGGACADIPCGCQVRLWRVLCARPVRLASGFSSAVADCSVRCKVSAKGRSLRVAPGSVLGALARDAKGDIRAAALAVVPATRVTGKIRFSAARVASGASQTDTDRADELTDEQGRSIRFVRNHVIVLERDRGELMRFLARRHGEIVSSLGRHHLVKVDPSTTDPAHLEPLAELLGGAPGRYRF